MILDFGPMINTILIIIIIIIRIIVIIIIIIIIIIMLRTGYIDPVGSIPISVTK